jgi:hypothetical protein
MVLPVKLAEDIFVSETKQLAIAALIRDRCEELGLSSLELVRRCGYQNVSKGLRRLEQLRAGNFTRTVGLIRALPVALEAPVEMVEEAIEQSQQYLRECAEAAWRAEFRPHAIIITERSRPEPIFVVAFIGVDVLLRVDFDLTAAPVTFIKQSLDGLRKKLARWRGSLPAFGRPVGFIVNYCPDCAVRFDLEGNPVELFDRAYRPGEATLSIGGRAMSHAELAAVFFGRQAVQRHSSTRRISVPNGRECDDEHGSEPPRNFPTGCSGYSGHRKWGKSSTNIDRGNWRKPWYHPQR